ncbi:MAG: nucleotide exchange factor GrpE [Bryobacterales bacterium]|nr:nucleotide exchange factor GrpE [Bryobacterales bacterium]
MQEEVKNPSDEGSVGVEDRAADPAPQSDTVEIADLADQLAAVAADRDRLQLENAETQDRLLRRQAEFENFRKRVEREKVELLEYAGLEAVRAILPILDDFERALKVESADKEYVRGMEMIHQRLLETLKKVGLEAIECAGQKFDPNLHHAVTRESSESVEEDTVLEVYQKGYNFKGRLLRPAMVKVSVRS